MMKPESPKQRALFSLAALVISALHFASFFDLEQSVLTDIRYFLYFAQRIAAGGVPHLDLFDNKTFLASFVGAIFYRIGELLGVDPLQSIRIGYLALSAWGGVLCFWIFRRLGKGSSLAGFLGLFAALSFGFMGAFAAIGNSPKILMNLCGLAMILAVARQQWFLAGFLGALAFMDWQVGALVGIAALAAAVTSGPRRTLATSQVVLGGAAGLAPFGIYYAAHGALGQALYQTLTLSLARGSTQLAETTLGTRLGRIGFVVERIAPGQEWLLAMAFVGLPVGLYWLWKVWHSEAGRLLLPLLLFTGGIASFSLVDFQRYGDFYALVSAMVLWLGVLWVGAFLWVRDRFAPSFRESPSLRWIVAAAALIVAIGIARPLWLRPEIIIQNRYINATVTLSEQRSLAAALHKRIGSGSFLALASSELLFLMPYTNPVPLIYFNDPAFHAYGEPDAETMDSASSRLVAQTDPDIFIFPGRQELNPEIALRYNFSEIRSPQGHYSVNFYERK
jgi:hypothetical protein